MLGRYQKIFRSRWSALFWAGTVLVSAYFVAADADSLPAPKQASAEISAKASAPKKEESLEELIAAARAAEDARQEALREAAR